MAPGGGRAPASRAGTSFSSVPVRSERRRLGHPPDEAPNRRAVLPERQPRDPHRARGGPLQPHQHADGRRLSRPVRPQQPEDLALANRKGEVAHRLDLAEPFRDPRKFDHEGQSRSPRVEMLSGRGSPAAHSAAGPRRRCGHLLSARRHLCPYDSNRFYIITSNILFTGYARPFGLPPQSPLRLPGKRRNQDAATTASWFRFTRTGPLTAHASPTHCSPLTVNSPLPPQPTAHSS